MIRKWVSYLLILLIALQSVAAIADAHQLHQAGSEHLTFEHPHDANTQNQPAPEQDEHDFRQQQLESLTDNSSSQYDCHHCCHCHGSSQIFIDPSNATLMPLSLGNCSAALNISYLSNLLSPDLRPPIV